MKLLKFVSVFVCSLSLCFASCASDGASCTATTQGDGIVLLTCEDGTTAIVESGTDGRDGVQGSAGLAGPAGPAGPDGPAGETGPQGASTLTLLKMDDESAGDNCPQGGVRVSAGVDDDADGTLDADEVDEEKFVCNGDGQPVTGVLEGSIVLRNTQDMLRYSRFDTVTDTVIVESGLAFIELPALIDVGALKVDGVGWGDDGFETIRRIRLTGLQQVNGDVYVNKTPQMRELELPALEAIYGDLMVWNNKNLDTLDLGSLTYVSGDVQIGRCGCITDADIEAMFEGVNVGGTVYIHDNGLGIGSWCS